MKGIESGSQNVHVNTRTTHREVLDMTSPACRWLMALIVAGAALAAPTAARANGGPPSLPGDKTGVILPRQETRIRVDWEELLFARHHRLCFRLCLP